MTDPQLIEKLALRVGMKSLLNMGAASCVYTEGCEGVSQEHLTAFAEQVAVYCALALGPAGLAAGSQAVPAWISVNDRLPELGPDEEGVEVWTWNGEIVDTDEFVACYEQPAGSAVGGWLRVGDWFASDNLTRVTHWMPFKAPAAPSNAGRG